MKENSKQIQNSEKIAERHFQLVEKLKLYLREGAINLLKAGAILYEIKTKKTYVAEDFSRTVTWEEFCASPDFPFPEKTSETARRFADTLIRIYAIFIKKLSLKEEEVAPVGIGKLSLIAPEAAKGRTFALDWLKKAEILTVRDLKTELRQKNLTLEEILECNHQEIRKVSAFYCEKCKTNLEGYTEIFLLEEIKKRILEWAKENKYPKLPLEINKETGEAYVYLPEGEENWKRYLEIHASFEVLQVWKQIEKQFFRNL